MFSSELCFTEFLSIVPSSTSAAVKSLPAFSLLCKSYACNQKNNFYILDEVFTRYLMFAIRNSLQSMLANVGVSEIKTEYLTPINQGPANFLREAG